MLPMKWPLAGGKQLCQLSYPVTTPVTYTMQTSLVYFIKHFPQKVCIWKRRNVVETKIVRFGWLALLQLTWVGKNPMFVIGKSNKLRCCKVIKTTPCRYRVQNKDLDGLRIIWRMGQRTGQKVCVRGS